MHNARYTKSEALRGAEICAGDLVECHSVKPDDLPKKLVRSNLKTLLNRELQDSTPLGGAQAQAFTWINESDASCFKDTHVIKLA